MRDEDETPRNDPGVYRELFEQSANGMLLIADGRILRANRALGRLLGYSLDRVVGRSPVEFIHPDDWARAIESIRTLVSEGTVEDPHAYRVIRQDGHAVWIETSSRLIRWSDRDVILATIHDVSEQRRVVSALRESESRYRELFDSVPIGLYRTTADGSILDVNPALVEMLGYSDRQALLDRRVDEGYAEGAERRAWRERIDREGRVRGSEARWKTYDGRELWVEEHARAVRTETGEVAFYEGSAQDISQRKRMEEALKREKAYFEQLFSAAPEAVVLCDNDGIVLRANREFRRLFGYTDNEAIGRRIDDLVAPSGSDRRAEAERITREVLSGTAVGVESVRHGRDGSLVHVSVLAQPIFLDDTQVGSYSIYRDVTARKEAELALQAAHAKVERLHEAAALLEHSRTLAKVYRTTIDSAERVLGYSHCALDIAADGHLITVATSPTTPPARFRRTRIEDAGIAGDAFMNGKPLIHDDPDPSRLAEGSSQAIASLITIPLGDVGVFQAASDMPGCFTEADARLLGILLSRTSAAIERLRLEAELKEQATHDPLTGVFNRRYFNEVIERETLRATRYDHPIGLLMIDVNRFKQINDEQGHHVGDYVLQTIAGVLKNAVRETDLVVRYGGDEFLVVLTETGTDAERVAGRIRASVSENARLREIVGFDVTVSVGSIAWSPDPDRPIARVLAEADERMYEEKRRA
jgi:diguanylate cyclase (GGDEF)-like protein/PAS domain S-box-containing protein